MENNQKGSSVEIKIPTTLTVKFKYNECRDMYGESITQDASKEMNTYMNNKENWSRIITDVNAYIQDGIEIDGRGMINDILNIKLESNNKALD